MCRSTCGKCLSSYIIICPSQTFNSAQKKKRGISCCLVSATKGFVGINKSQYIFAPSQLTLKVKGQRRPVMLQKDPQDIYSLSLSLPPSLAPPLPLRECRSEHCSRPLAFAESCTVMRSLCLSPRSSSPLPLPYLSLSHPSTSLSPSLSFSLYLAASIKFPVTQWCRGYSSFPLSFSLFPRSLSLALES